MVGVSLYPGGYGGTPYLQDNKETLLMCEKYNVNYLLIDDEYDVDIEL